MLVINTLCICVPLVRPRLSFIMSTQTDPAFVKAYYDEMWSSTSVSCEYGLFCDVVLTTRLPGLVIYEFIVTFLDEIRVVWMTPIAASTILLGSVRYTMLISAAIQVLATPTTVEGCRAIVVLTHVLNLIAFAQTALFSALRVFAIGNRNYYLSILVFLLGIVPFATNLMLTAIAAYGYVSLPPPVGPTCYSDAPISVRTSNIMTYATRACLILSDVLVLIVTWIKTFGQWRSARQANVRVSLTTCLLRDGTVYFIVLLACNMAHMLTFNLSVIVRPWEYVSCSTTRSH